MQLTLLVEPKKNYLISHSNKTTPELNPLGSYINQRQFPHPNPINIYNTSKLLIGRPFCIRTFLPTIQVTTSQDSRGWTHDVSKQSITSTPITFHRGNSYTTNPLKFLGFNSRNMDHKPILEMHTNSPVSPKITILPSKQQGHHNLPQKKCHTRHPRRVPNS